VHGGRSRLPIDLSASLNPLGPSRPALEAARSAGLTRYPDPAAAPRAAAAAARHRIPPETVVPIPGASWGLWFGLVTYGGPGRRCVALGPCFGEYRRAAEISGCSFEETAMDLEQAVDSSPDIVLVGNPANPAASVVPAERLAAACKANPDILFLVDEAFAAFAPAGTSLLNGCVPPANAIVVRSLTKELGLPGLRMGYLVAPEESATELRAMLPAWPLSSPALAAATAGCADLEHIRAGAEVGRRHVRVMSEALAVARVDVCPSSANYLLCRAPGLLERLAGRGIAARDCSSFGLPDHVRLAAPAPAELAAVLEAISG
jgi:histidinol-phosphate/aromatic aminotransferase/cobyric acid decarboxylase-like protein